MKNPFVSNKNLLPTHIYNLENSSVASPEMSLKDKAKSILRSQFFKKPKEQQLSSSARHQSDGAITSLSECWQGRERGQSVESDGREHFVQPKFTEIPLVAEERGTEYAGVICCVCLLAVIWIAFIIAHFH